MLNKNAQIWVDALKSGKYPQAKYRLTLLKKDQSLIGHCCLGVACELAIQDGVQISIRTTDANLGEKEGEILAKEYEGNFGLLPTKVQKWLGLAYRAGGFGFSSLAQLNDSGKTFAEIAAVIESDPEGLFVKDTIHANATTV
jgi:hypothetical protein